MATAINTAAASSEYARIARIHANTARDCYDRARMAYENGDIRAIRAAYHEARIAASAAMDAYRAADALIDDFHADTPTRRNRDGALCALDDARRHRAGCETLYITLDIAAWDAQPDTAAWDGWAGDAAADIRDAAMAPDGTGIPPYCPQCQAVADATARRDIAHAAYHASRAAHDATAYFAYTTACHATDDARTARARMDATRYQLARATMADGFRD